ncbi:MAG: hypothetical protein SZ59_C0001G0093 [candidate division TM6 bacterium GW2011_GWF2_28_16]|nr:MAG: hypothetical protein SZ59_C0001G0093 [candidate division TM6 bacterium GW2011_GWF2_28_16]
MCAQCKPNNNIKVTDTQLASQLSGLLHKVLNFHEVDGLSQMVLHELGHENSFSFNRATYLIDNPDFNHLLGVAGYSCDECHFHKQDLWQDPYSFLKDMDSAQYHNKVKTFLNDGLKKTDLNLESSKEIHELGNILGLEKPEFLFWKMKHGNNGLLLFESKLNNQDLEPESFNWRRAFLHNITALLSFCGI